MIDIGSIFAQEIGQPPTQVSNCALWLRADVGITLIDNLVSTWADQSGNNRNFSAPDAASRIAYNATINGKSVLNVNPSGTTSHKLNIGTNIVLNDFSVFFVLNGTSNNGWLMSAGYSSAILPVTFKANSTDTNLSGAWMLNQGVNVYYLQRVGTTLTLYKNDTLVQTITVNGTAFTFNSMFQAFSDTSTIFRGAFAELALFSRGLTDDERKNVTANLRCRWGL